MNQTLQHQCDACREFYRRTDGEPVFKVIEHNYDLFAAPKLSFKLSTPEGLQIGTANLDPMKDGRAYLHSVLISESRRGCGYGEKLMRHIIDTVKGIESYRELCLVVLKDNHPAIRLYEKLGFQADREDDSHFGMTLPV
jgi:ribosomal protein S18 acetylase RimI-like enzyme